MHLKFLKKFFNIFTTLTLLVNSFNPLLIASVYAQDVTPADAIAQIEVPAPTVAVEVPSEEQVVEPTVAIEPTITTEPTVTPEPTDETVSADTPETTEDSGSTDVTDPAGVPDFDLSAPATSEESAQSSSVTTDKADYTPTELATITGTGYVPGAVLTIEILVDGVVFATGTAVADDSGNFIYPYQLDGTYRPYYEVVVKSDSGEVLATTSFTDSVKKIEICHKTSSTVNPWNAIKVGEPSLPRHFGHGDFLYTGPFELGPIHNGNLEQMSDADEWCQENDPSLLPTPTGTVTPAPLCGNGVINDDETCDYGTGYNGGQSSCSSDCQLVTVGEHCDEGDVVYFPNFQVDIDGSNGDPYAKTDWDPATGSSSDSTYGNWDGHEAIGMVVGPNKCTTDESAEFIIGEAGKFVTELQVRALDGISYTDSFDIYLNDIFLAHYEDNGAGGEIWDDLNYPVPGPSGYGVEGPVTVKFYSVDDPWKDCEQWGQVAVNWVEVSGYSCELPDSTPTPTPTSTMTPTPTATLTPSPTATPTTTPVLECGNGELDGEEDCDFGDRNGGVSSCTIDCEWAYPDPYCRDKVEPLETYESVDIDGLNDGFYSKTFWSPATGLPSNTTYGNWDGHEAIGMVVTPGDCETADKTADFTIGEAGKFITELQIRALDGISNTDSFDIYVNNEFLAHYEDNNAGGEIWDTLVYPVPGSSGRGVEGPATVRFESVDDPWGGCETWGQVAINWVDAGQYVCERETFDNEPLCKPVYSTSPYNDVNVGDEADEASYDLKYWGPVEPTASGGNWGEGTPCEDGNCRVIYAPDEVDPHNRIAVFSMDLGASEYKEMRFRALDGISGTDSFEVFIGSELVYRWLDTLPAGGNEIWGDHAFDVSGFDGIRTFTIRSIDREWSGYPTYGQVAFTNIGVWNYECEEPEPVCGNGEKEEGEDCDGQDGITAGYDFCTPNCQLVPIYDGEHACPVNTIPVEIDTIGLSSTDSNGEAVALETGKTYLFEASGTYLYNKSSANNAADAAYGTRDGWVSTRGDIGIWGTNRGVTSILGDFGNGVGVIEWDNDTNYDTDHTYQKAYTATSDSVQFLISDWYSNWYGSYCSNQSCMGDNSGSLTLTVFECEPVTTGDIYGYKWHDGNGDGTPNCEQNLATEDSSDEICEEKLEGWTIFIDENDNGILDGEERSTLTDSDGNYRFEDLEFGDYRVCEVQQEGWVQTYPAECHNVTLPCIGFSSHTLTNGLLLNDDVAPTCAYNFGNAEVAIDLVKDVSTTASVGPSSTVTYTLTVTNTGDLPLTGVIIKDALPGGFTYVAGTSELTYLGSTSNFDDPAVDGTGALVWSIGDLLPGSEKAKTITYDVTLSADLYSGIYTNIAVAVGYYYASEQTATPTPYDELFTMFKVNEAYAQMPVESRVVAGPVLAMVTVDRSLSYSAGVGGEVLGASTEVLPATGSQTALLYVFMLMAVLGVAIKLLIRSNPKILVRLAKIFTGVTVIAALFSGNAYAYSDTIVIQDLPEYTNTDTFKVSYSALSDSSITVRCYIRKDGLGDWRAFGGVQTGASGWVQVSGSDIYDNDGKYFIKCEMQSPATASDETSTFIDRSGPSPVSNYWKEKVAGGFYKIHWKNPHDDDFSRVMIYRSEDREFTADGSTKVYEIGGNKEQEMYWDNVGLDPNKDYYYAIRALDKAGNASSIVADPETAVFTSTSSVTVYGEGTGGGFILPDEGEGEELEDGNGDILGEEDVEEEEIADEESSNLVQRVATFARERTKITLGIIAVVAGIAYLAYKKYSEGKKK